MAFAGHRSRAAIGPQDQIERHVVLINENPGAHHPVGIGLGEDGTQQTAPTSSPAAGFNQERPMAALLVVLM